MRQFANARTRTRQGSRARWTSRALLRDWEQTSRDAELGTLRDLARVIWRARRAHAQSARASRTARTRRFTRTPARRWRGWPRSSLARGTDARAGTRGDGRRAGAGAGSTRRLDARRPRSLHRPAPARPRGRAGTRSTPGSSWKTWPTGRSPGRRERRCCGWTPPSGRASRTRCAARTGRASTARTAPSCTPPARSCRWRSNCSPTRKPTARRTLRASRPPRCSAQTSRN